MILEFDPAAHRYTMNKRVVPSVTQVLDPLISFEGIPYDVLENARVFGQHVHQACDMHLRGELDWDSLSENVCAYVMGYDRFLVESKFIVIATEERVASLKYGYAGTLDLRGQFPNQKRATIDIKSTAVLPRTVGPQTAAYEQCVIEMQGERYGKRHCLHLKPHGYKLTAVHDGPGIQDMTVFVSALNLWKWRNAA